MELTLLCPQDASRLWAFENQHRAYFENWIHHRPDTFYTPLGFERALQSALQEQAAGLAFYYLMVVGGELVGRISLTQVRATPLRSATLVYRIAPSHSGQGLTTEAVRRVMQKAFHTHHLQRLEASARPENSAAIRVLLKNGFQRSGQAKCSVQLHRPWLDLLYFEALAPIPATVT